jgi:uncharacterized protein YbjT (DUF2867 family)
MEPAIAVMGATGHTGRFVVQELRRRGRRPILLGRSPDRLAAAARESGLETRVITDSPASYDARLSGVSAVVNCAGPFLDTAVPMVEAALRAGVHYLDVTAEQAAALALFERFGGAAARAGVVVVPAAGFFGGLADLLATAATQEWGGADELHVAVALDRWWPTEGTRRTGERNTVRRTIVNEGRLEPLEDAPPPRTWAFPAPFGVQEVAQVPLSEIVTMSRHLRATTIRSFMNLAPLGDLRDPETPPPTAVDVQGRSAQSFLMHVIARNHGDGAERHATAAGRDIYAITAPIVVEAAERLVRDPGGRAGVFALGELFDVRDVLASLGQHMSIHLP